MPIRTIIAMPGMRPALLASGTVLASLDLLIAFLPAWAEERGVSMLTVAWLLAIRATISVAVRLVQSHVVRAVGRRATIAAAILAAVAGLASLPLANQYTAVAAMVLLGVGLALPQPLTLSWVVASVPAGSRGSTLGARLLSNRLAQAAIPLAVGAVASGSGTAGVFLTCAAILTATSAAVARAPMRDPDG